MSQVQFIEHDGHREFAVIPIDLWERVKHFVDNLDDELLFDQAKIQDDGFRVPAAVLDAELAGDHPVRAWRAYRRMTQKTLADITQLSVPYISQIENRQRTGTTDVMLKIATALDVPLDMLLESENSSDEPVSFATQEHSTRASQNKSPVVVVTKGVVSQ